MASGRPVAVDERGRKALFVEVKWSELNEREVERLLAELERKAEETGLNGYEKFYGAVTKESSSDLGVGLKRLRKILSAKRLAP
ncbi:MAG: hypothetical protein DRN91_05960 [Candidatus Alkanophagales archaeon]|nr:MAG: hypothetical protein DRN91_05960 [Candidatus Alkanophagales archaeon]